MKNKKQDNWRSKKFEFTLEGFWGVIASYAILGVFAVGAATTLRETFWLTYSLYKLITGLL